MVSPPNIQSYAQLIVVDAAHHTVTATSQNAPPGLGGRPLSELFSESVCRSILAAQGNRYALPIPLPGPQPVDWGERQLVLHTADEQLVLEVEPCVESFTYADSQLAQRQLADEFEAAQTLDEALAAVCDFFCEALPFERCLVYQLEHRGAGMVRNERIDNPEISPLLNYHFREEDFPQEGFDLHRQQSIFLYSLEGGAAAAIHGSLVPAADKCIRRRVGCRYNYPTMRQFMAATGIATQLSLALRVRGKLWGLIFAHSMHTVRSDRQFRAAVQLIGKQLSQTIAYLQQTDARYQESNKLAAVQARVRENIVRAPNLVQGFGVEDPSLVDLLPGATGAVVSLEEELVLLGKMPSEQATRDMVEWLRQRGSSSGGGIWHTHHLAGQYPDVTENLREQAAGVIVAPLDRRCQDFMAWFRPEDQQEVAYGSRDRQEVQQADNAQEVFQTTLELRRGFAKPWTTDEIAVASELQSFVRDVVLERYAQLRRVNRQLRMAYDEMESFTYTVSHDLRAPLRGIDGFAEILLEEYSTDLDGEAQKLVRAIQGQAERMNQFISSILRLGRIGQRQLDIDRHDISSLVEEAASQVQAGNQRHIQVRVEGTPPPIAGDKELLRTVFRLLIDNAVAYTPPETSAVVLVGFRPMPDTPEEGEYYVADHGVGIAPEHHERIFDMFQRLGANDAGGRLGSGLAVVRRILHKHQGDIRVESATGQGAVFLFYTDPENV